MKKENVVVSDEKVTVKEEIIKGEVVSKNVGHVMKWNGMEFSSKTSMIIYLSEQENKSRSEISKIMDIRYQFVNNVLSNRKVK